MQNTLTIRAFFDTHMHFRRGGLLQSVTPHEVAYCKQAVAEPNTDPAIFTAQDAIEYAPEILAASPNPSFVVHPAIQLTPLTTPEMVDECADAGFLFWKAYPLGRTTNSEYGILNYMDPALWRVLERLEKRGALVQFHGECPEKPEDKGTERELFCLDLEELFLEIFTKLAEGFMGLRMTMEHITTQAALDCVTSLGPNVAASITPHHLLITLNNVVGHMLEPDNFCKPVAKRPTDRAALRKAVCAPGPHHKKLHHGSDGAPHVRSKKYAAKGCAGVFNTPDNPGRLAQIFDEEGALPLLEAFTSGNALDFYGLPIHTETVTILRETYKIATEYAGLPDDPVVPFQAGEKLNWKLQAPWQTKP